MQHDILVLPNGSEGKRYKFEFRDRKNATQNIVFVLDGKAEVKGFIEDLTKSLKEYMRKE